MSDTVRKTNYNKQNLGNNSQKLRMFVGLLGCRPKGQGYRHPGTSDRGSGARELNSLPGQSLFPKALKRAPSVFKGIGGIGSCLQVVHNGVVF